jgi:hypothetical protein
MTTDNSNLIVEFVARGRFPAKSFDLGTLRAGEPFKQQVAAVFRSHVDPGDDVWGSGRTVENNWRALVQFTRFSAENGCYLECVNDLQASVWNQFREQRTYRSVKDVRAVLRCCEPLSPQVELILAARSHKPPTSVQRSISDDAMRRYKKCVAAISSEAYDRITDSRRLLAEYQNNPGALTADQRGIGEVLDQVDSIGFAGGFIEGWRRLSADHAAAINGSRTRRSVGRAYSLLFLENVEMIAFAMGLIAVTGINTCDVLNLRRGDLSRVDAADGSEPAVFRVELFKPRRGKHAYSIETWSDTGSGSSGALIRQLLELLDPAHEWLSRCHNLTEQPFIIGHRVRPRGADLSAPPIRGWSSEGNFVDARTNHLKPRLDEDLRWITGQPLRNYFTTRFQAQGHSEAVNLSDYQLRDQRRRAESVPVVEAALTELVSATVVAVDQSDSVGEETVGATCCDYRHGFFSKTHSVCRESFLTCLRCPNATVSPVHSPRWKAISESLEAERSKVTDADWDEVFRADWERVSDLLTPGNHFSAEQLGAAEISDEDREIVAMQMGRELDTV